MRELSGSAAKDLIDREIGRHTAGLIQPLALWDPAGATAAWLDTIRAVEEFINLPGEIEDGRLRARLLSLPVRALIRDPRPLAAVVPALSSRFDAGVAGRFVQTVTQAAAIAEAFALNRRIDLAGHFATVVDAIGYFQSRRRHLVAMLHTLPASCRGARQVPRLDTLNQFLPLVELGGVALTTLHQQAMLTDVYQDFTLRADEYGAEASHGFEALDGLFLEPDRVSVVDMLDDEQSARPASGLEPVNPRRVFSAAETRNAILIMEATYAEFGLSASVFGPLAAMVRAALRHSRDDYFIDLDQAAFDVLAAQADASGVLPRVGPLVHQSCDYVLNTNSYAPFVHVGGRYLSSVTLLQRFLYHARAVILNPMRRYQIRSGFIFEENVKRALAGQGFAITDIKRIERKEFDVVATLHGVVYNVQCKNNFVDLAKAEADRKRFVRYNRQLDRYYAAALAKEESREDLLRKRLGVSEVRHVVLSRFPVVTQNPRVLPYAKIGEFRDRFGG